MAESAGEKGGKRGTRKTAPRKRPSRGAVPPPKGTFRVRGGSLGLKVSDPIRVSEKLKEGLPYRALEILAKESHLPTERIAEVAHIPKRTLVRRKQGGKLTRDESEGIYRLGVLYERALELFEGDRDGAVRWLERPNRGLAGKPPLELAETEVGGRLVEDLILRLESGVIT